MRPLRQYQVETYARGRAAYAAGHRSLLIVSPTGSGKTRLACEFVSSHLSRVPTGRVLWLAHRTELVTQAADHLEAEGVPPVYVLQSGVSRGRSDARVTVASVDTLVARELTIEGITMVVLDECHHYVAAEWHAAVETYRKTATVIGLTATPCRSDGTALGNLFDVIVPGPQIAELQALGHLVPCDVEAPAKFSKDLAEDPVEAYLRLCPGKRCVVFCLTCAQSADLAERFRAVGVPAKHVDGDTSAEARADALRSFKTGETLVLTNVYVLTEGWDCPEIFAVMLARGCGHIGMFIQIVGRALRPGKDRALLIDLLGNIHRLSYLPGDPLEYNLEGKPIKGLTKLPPIRQCPQCGAVYRPGSLRACVRCGHVLPPPLAPKVRKQKLERVTVVATREEKERYYAEMRDRVARRGYKLGYAGVMFKEKFGHWPSRETIDAFETRKRRGATDTPDTFGLLQGLGSLDE